MFWPVVFVSIPIARSKDPADNNLTNKTDRKNQLITYTYDQLNRLAGKTYSDDLTMNYTYDLDSWLTQVNYDPFEPRICKYLILVFGGPHR